MVQATVIAAIAAAVQFASPALLLAEESGRPALMIEIDGAIGPATSRHVKEALTTAGERRVDVVILRLNTPGGLATSMREIIADVLGSSVPVIGYVAPSGAHAASAGTYILYATHIAAMAPGTNLGAATPVLIDGRTVELAGGDMRQLATKGLTIERLDPGWLIRLLSVITDPNVAFILLMVGIYGLIFEFSTPGAIAPGVVGTICLLLGLYALNMLPINYAGLALMLLGIAFLVVETFNPTVVLGLGGVAAFLLGAAMLFRIEAPGYQLSWTVVIIALAMIVSLTVIVLGSLWRARRNPARVGGQAMRGLPAKVLDWSGSEGHVFTHGERWQAHGVEALTPGETVEVAGIKDLTLVVRRRSARTVSEGGV